MKTSHFVSLIVAAVLLGCGKPHPPTESSAPPPAKSAASVESLISSPANVPPPPSPTEPSTESAPPAIPPVDPATSSPDLERLNRALTLFIASRHHFPKDIAELCREEELYPPVPPAGKHLLLDPNARKVILVSGP